MGQGSGARDCRGLPLVCFIGAPAPRLPSFAPGEARSRRPAPLLAARLPGAGVAAGSRQTREGMAAACGTFPSNSDRPSPVGTPPEATPSGTGWASVRPRERRGIRIVTAVRPAVNAVRVRDPASPQRHPVMLETCFQHEGRDPRKNPLAPQPRIKPPIVASPAMHQTAGTNLEWQSPFCAQASVAIWRGSRPSMRSMAPP